MPPRSTRLTFFNSSAAEGIGGEERNGAAGLKGEGATFAGSSTIVASRTRTERMPVSIRPRTRSQNE